MMSDSYSSTARKDSAAHALTQPPCKLTEAGIELLREALAAISEDQPERPVMLSNLAAALRARAKQTASSPDLDESVVLLREALAAMPADQPERPVMLSTSPQICKPSMSTAPMLPIWTNPLPSSVGAEAHA